MAMAIHDENDASPSAGVFSSENAISLCVKLKDQFSCGNEFCPKVRKPYTITKQRERWTEEEHRKFLEALKLYGRAWLKIEEHVGTKTAVQIRSHAQKFFYKIAQDPNGSNVNTEESIEIPPPRPKRKPMHPYPRKLAHSTKEELSIPEHSTKSYLSLSEQDNQSPKSVLSAMGSDTIGLSGSNTQDESLSPVSSSTGIHDGSILFSQPNSSTEDIGSPPAAVKASVSSPSQLPVKLELFSQDNACAKGTSAEIVSARSLTLFGTIVFVADSHRPSSPTMGTCKPLPSCEQEEKLAQPLPSPVTETESSTETAHCVWGHLPRAVQALYLMHFQNGFPNLVGSGSVTPLPLWPYYGGLPFPSNNQDQVKGSLDSNLSEVQEVNEEGSWSGSNTGSLNSDKCLDADSQSRYTSLEKEEKEVSILEWKPSSRSAFSQHKISSEKYKRGFVPYKRSRVETDRQSLTMKGQERQENRIQLCL